MTPLLHGINVVSLTVTDLDAARHFYGQTLGLGDPWFDDRTMGWIEWAYEHLIHQFLWRVWEQAPSTIEEL